MERSSEGLDLANMEAMTSGEVNGNLASVWTGRGPLYELYASSLMLDYAPQFAKLHRWGSDLFGRPDPVNITLLACQNLHSYMMQGWQTGIHNSFKTLLRNGMAVQQILELVMFNQLYAGMRGLGHVFRAVGRDLPSYRQPLNAPAPFPQGWGPDPEAFECGLDLTTREMTRADLANLTAWYEKTLGYLPKSIQFGLKYHPEFVKVNRGKWEVAVRTLPKQIVPYIMLRHHTITGSEEGLREATLLALAWGITPELIARAITATAMFYTNFEGLYAPFKVVEEILEAHGRACS
jgi:alkylhydroperoxidase/carboxymuconolactone decarboxylase family protein YurZ